MVWKHIQSSRIFDEVVKDIKDNIKNTSTEHQSLSFLQRNFNED